MTLEEETLHDPARNLIDVLMEESKLYLIFEYLTMDLKKYMDSLGNKLLEPAVVKSYLYQIDRVLIQLLTISDHTCNCSRLRTWEGIWNPSQNIYTHEVVTLWYRAPEILLGTRYSCAIDMWSIGCIFAEMATKKPLFQGDSEIDQLFRIFRILRMPTEEIWPGVTQLSDYKATFPNWMTNNLESQVKTLDADGLNLLQPMLTYDPVYRISARAALKHPYFGDLDTSKLPVAKT
ncbi:Uncharacterized protein DBV15_01024 [Temnothorax longispinosus]|uniref:Protein kinase domain-containing protein n=1 Tax=Temnothorax longispinosus TaxID=300112 RepID=A0A4S2JB43_9HYME|nr:Uncharacterized protein DBV15_01024 [Temnothorax longispinosus]